MTVTVRLDPLLAKKLEKAADSEGPTKSEFIRRCLQEQLSKQDDLCLPWELGKEVFGRYGSGRPDLATNRKLETVI